MKIKVKIENQQYEVEIEDISARPIVAQVEGETFEIWPEEEAAPRRPRPVVPAPPAAPSAESIARYAKVFTPVEPDDEDDRPREGVVFTVRAPIPGVITEVMVHPGDSITKGQPLCNLEAMKMNNTIRANTNGTVSNVLVSVGQAVKHNDSLIEISE